MERLRTTVFSLKNEYKLTALAVGCAAICMKFKQADLKAFISSDPKDYLILALSLLLAKSYYHQKRMNPQELAQQRNIEFSKVQDCCQHLNNNEIQ